MSIVCTGSIAYDYLMNFPGYFRDHILPDSLDKLSLSFLVDSLVRQRGGIAPNIAYTLALLGESPLLVGTVGEDFGDYRAWLNSKGIDTRFVREIPGKYTASFFANTDLANNQIASFYAGAMANAAEISIHELVNEQPELVVISPNDPKAMDQYVRPVQRAGHSLPVRPQPADRALGPGGAAPRRRRGDQPVRERIRVRAAAKTHRPDRSQILNSVEFMVVT